MKNFIKICAQILLTFSTTLVAASCSISRPCSEAGDLSGLPPIERLERGDKQCYQKKMKDGTYMNDGKFIQRYRSGIIAIEGEFHEGKKEGIWYFYNAKGEKTAEKFFMNGVEKGAGTFSQ